MHTPRATLARDAGPRYTTIEAPMIRKELLRLLGMILFAALAIAAALFVVAHLGVTGNAIVG